MYNAACVSSTRNHHPANLPTWPRYRHGRGWWHCPVWRLPCREDLPRWSSHQRGLYSRLLLSIQWHHNTMPGLNIQFNIWSQEPHWVSAVSRGLLLLFRSDVELFDLTLPDFVLLPWSHHEPHPMPCRNLEVGGLIFVMPSLFKKTESNI